jgi:hypothetical protein
MTSDWTTNFQRRLEDVGWRVERSKSNQFKVYDRSDRQILVFSATPSDHRSMTNALSQAKKAGLLLLESEVKLRRERDRLARLAADRESNGHKPERAVPPALFTPPPVPPPAESTAATMSTVADDAASVGVKTHDEKVKMSVKPENLGDVDGVAIVAVAPAKIQTPIMTAPAPLADAEELLLADDRVLYRCLKPTPQGPCHSTFDTANSLRSHITFHSRRVPPTTPAYRAKQERLVRENVKPPAVATSEEREVAASPKTTTSPTSPAATSTEVDRLRRRVDVLAGAVAETLGGLKKIQAEVAELQCEVNELPLADEETLRKAAEFDKVKSTFSSMFS